MKVINTIKMKNIFKLLFVLGLLTFNFSCDEVEYIELNSNANTELMLSLESVSPRRRQSR